ncbi:MAG TPA: CHASE3 domain-containing protein [Steroidobacteraceae bacterium]
MAIGNNASSGVTQTVAGQPGVARGWPAPRKVRTGFAFALACLAMVGIASYLSVQHLRTNAGWVEHTHQVLTQLDHLLSLSMEAETAERGYVITGDEDYLASYRAAVGAAGDVERELVQLTADSQGQQQRLDRLNALVTARLEALRKVNEARQAVGFSAAQELIQNGPGKRIHNDLRQQIEQVAQAERSILGERQGLVDRSIAITTAIGIGSSLLGLGCVAWAGRVSRRDFIERKRIEDQREALELSLASQLNDLRRLQELNSRLIVLRELPKMLEEILDATIELQRADFGNIQLYDPQGATLSIVAQRGFSQAFLDHFRVVNATEPSACGRALQGLSRVIIEDVETDAEYAPHRAAAAEAGYRGVQSTPLFGRDGSVKGVLSTHFREPHRPSDHHMQMTDLYMLLAAELMERVQDAETIRLARDEADRANRAKGRFLATASHDLRQPLQALSLLNGTLRRLSADADTSQVALQQEQAITVMSGLLNALLDISKLESGTVRPEIVNCDLQALFEQLRVEFSVTAARKGLRLEVAACNDFALSDRTLLGQILRNLLSNAIRYTREGSVQLRCEPAGEQFRLSVADTGIGIANTHLRDIFEEFYQVGVPANTVREGHGLGLNIVKRVAQLLNHPLQVESEPGKGSVFSILVPRAQADSRLQVAGEVLPASASSPRKEHVLIVDDDRAVLDATRLLLKVEGYRVSVAASFDAAIDKVRESNDIDVLVTDFHLGDGRLGTDVARAVTEALGRTVRTVLITGDTSSAMRSIAQDSHIRLASKPIKADELLSVLRKQTEAPPQMTG